MKKGGKVRGEANEKGECLHRGCRVVTELLELTKKIEMGENLLMSKVPSATDIVLGREYVGCLKCW